MISHRSELRNIIQLNPRPRSTINFIG